MLIFQMNPNDESNQFAGFQRRNEYVNFQRR